MFTISFSLNLSKSQVPIRNRERGRVNIEITCEIVRNSYIKHDLRNNSENVN